MAFTKLNLSIGRGAYNVSSTPYSLVTHTYRSSSDSFNEITSSNYFQPYLGENSDLVQIGDLFQVRDNTLEERMYVITSLDPIELTLDSGNLTEEKFIYQTQFGGVFDTPISSVIEVRKIGTCVTIGIPSLAGTANNSVVLSNTITLPIQYTPTTSVGLATKLIKVIDNATNKVGLIHISSSGVIDIYSDVTEAAFSGTGPTGFESFYMSWITD